MVRKASRGLAFACAAATLAGGVLVSIEPALANVDSSNNLATVEQSLVAAIKTAEAKSYPNTAAEVHAVELAIAQVGSGAIPREVGPVIFAILTAEALLTVGHGSGSGGCGYPSCS
jgi:hypothetical protein